MSGVVLQTGMFHKVKVISTDYRGNTVDYADQSTKTYSSVDIGTASSDRYVLVMVAGQDVGSAGATGTMTIGGVSATLLAKVDGGGTNNAFSQAWIANVTSGSTATIVHSIGQSIYGHSITVYALTGVNPTAYDTATDAQDGTACSTTINTINGGLVVAAASAYTGTDFVWTGVTIRWQEPTMSSGSNRWGTVADHTPTSNETARTVSYTSTTSGSRGLTVVSLRPA